MSSGHLYVLIPDMKSLKHFLHRMARYVELELKKTCGAVLRQGCYWLYRDGGKTHTLGVGG